jgi:hypothetical protein
MPVSANVHTIARVIVGPRRAWSGSGTRWAATGTLVLLVVLAYIFSIPASIAIPALIILVVALAWPRPARTSGRTEASGPGRLPAARKGRQLALVTLRGLGVGAAAAVLVAITAHNAWPLLALFAMLPGLVLVRWAWNR